MIDGDIRNVPLYLEKDLGLTPDSNALLQAVTVLGGNLDRYNNDISKLSEDISKIADDPDAQGLIIEDEDGAGMVNIDHEITTASRREVGEWQVPTDKLAEMVKEWADYETTPEVN